MPSETMNAIVLRYANYRERDRMLSLLTPEHGRVEVLSRGCRRPKSPLMTASELFVQGEYVVFRTGERFTLTACTVADTFYPLRLEPYRLTCGSYMLGLCQVAAQPEQPAEGLFSLLLRGLTHMTYCEDEAAIAIMNAFLLLYASEIGYRPRLNHCAKCKTLLSQEGNAHLDIQAGGLLCNACAGNHQNSLTQEQVSWMRDVLARGFEVALTQADTALFNILRRYVESRIESTIKAGRLLP